MTAPSDLRLPGTPPRWVNHSLEFALRVPVLRAIVGRGFATITVTGARSGHRYSTPVQYFRDDDRYLVLSQQSRLWWRNIIDHPEIELTIRGNSMTCPARIAEPGEARILLPRLLADNPKLAGFYGVEIDDDGMPDQAACEQLGEALVVIVIDA